MGYLLSIDYLHFSTRNTFVSHFCSNKIPVNADPIFFVVNDTITIHDTGTTSLTQETLELASMDVDTVDSTEPTLNFLPSDNPSSTTTKAPHVEASPTVVHSVAHSDLASPKDVQTTKHIPGSGESAHKDRSADGRSVLNMTPGGFLSFLFYGIAMWHRVRVLNESISEGFTQIHSGTTCGFDTIYLTFSSVC